MRLRYSIEKRRSFTLLLVTFRNGKKSNFPEHNIVEVDEITKYIKKDTNSKLVNIVKTNKNKRSSNKVSK